MQHTPAEQALGTRHTLKEIILLRALHLYGYLIGLNTEHVFYEKPQYGADFEPEQVVKFKNRIRFYGKHR